jgi:uncharacterized C2H2 Zn-finger protein
MPDQKDWRCEQCDQMFQSDDEYQKHNQQYHAEGAGQQGQQNQGQRRNQ